MPFIVNFQNAAQDYRKRAEERRRLDPKKIVKKLPPSQYSVAKITSVCLLQVDQGAAETGVEGAAGRALRPRLPPPPPPWSSP